jgi:polar amino acid transport system substrate-binding protein
VPAAFGQASIDPALIRVIAPTGRLRAAINLGNPILANRDPGTGLPVGVSLDLAEELARRLGVACELVVFDAAGRSVDAVALGQADIGFFAIDPVRGAGIAFSDPYVLIEGAYLVHDDSPIRGNDEVDREGRRIVVGKGSAYDLFLTREMKRAQLLRAPTSQAVVDMFLREGADVAAGVRQQLEADARRVSGLRVLDGRFMVIEQAMGLPKTRGAQAAGFLGHFVEDMKASGFVTRSLVRHRIEGAVVAPAGH